MDHDKAEYCILFRRSRQERMTFAEKREYAKEVRAGLPEKNCNLGLLAEYAENGDFREELLTAVIEKSVYVNE